MDIHLGSLSEQQHRRYPGIFIQPTPYTNRLFRFWINKPPPVGTLTDTFSPFAFYHLPQQQQELIAWLTSISKTCQFICFFLYKAPSTSFTYQYQVTNLEQVPFKDSYTSKKSVRLVFTRAEKPYSKALSTDTSNTPVIKSQANTLLLWGIHPLTIIWAGVMDK